MARHRPRRRLRASAAALSVVAALFLCANACATPTSVHLDTAPARKLYLSLAFSNMLVAADQVTIEVRFSTGPNNWVQLANNQHLTINGRGPVSSPTPPLVCCRYTYKVPRVHTGEQYTIIYTDERRQQTSVTIPAPERELALTSPAAHAHLPIPPQGGTVTVEYAIPEIIFAQPPATPATQTGLDQAPKTLIRADAGGQCKRGHDSLPATSIHCFGASAEEVYWIGSTTTTPYGKAGRFAAGTLAITDTLTLPDAGAYAGFANLAAGPGELSIEADVGWNLPATGFAGVHFGAGDLIAIPITWG